MKDKDPSDDEKLKNLTVFVEQSVRLFQIEANRRNEIESKAVNIVGFIGIMMSIMIFGFQEIKSLPSTQLQIVASVFAFGMILATIACFILALRIVQPTNFRTDPNPEAFRTGYYDKKHAHTLDVLAANISDSWGKNREVNDKKARNIEHLVKLVLLDVVFLGLFLFTILFSNLSGC